MCVIFWVQKERPSKYMVEKAYDHNDDGAGVASREMNEAGEAVVYWKKGLDKEQMVEMCATLPLPYVAHFRINSVGGVRPSLTHPFPVHKSGSCALEGRTKGHVLFHNGTWKEWEEYMRQAAIFSNTPLPMGRNSDTRAMAWLCSIYGPGWMETLPDQKGIIYGPTDAQTQIFDGNGWTKINDVWCSNDYFYKPQQVQQVHNHGHMGTGGSSHSNLPTTRGTGMGHNGKYCRYDMCANQTLDDKGYCFIHPGGTIRGVSQTTVMGPKEATQAKSEATGGSRVPPSPFVKLAVAAPVATSSQERLPLELAPNEVVTIELATQLWKGSHISHNLLKKIKRHWDIATTPGTKASKRAEQALKQITMTLTSLHSNGPVH